MTTGVTVDSGGTILGISDGKMDGELVETESGFDDGDGDTRGLEIMLGATKGDS